MRGRVFSELAKEVLPCCIHDMASLRQLRSQGLCRSRAQEQGHMRTKARGACMESHECESPQGVL